jgi:CheY-like chemotaxis protein
LPERICYTCGFAAGNRRSKFADARFPFDMPSVPSVPSVLTAIPKTSAKAGASAAMATPTAFRILVIEDNADLAKLFADMFGIMGCASEVALNAESGSEATIRSRPDLVFCDLHLPGSKDGFDFARDLRNDPSFAQVPLIAITGATESGVFERARKAGFDHIFAKPFKFREIEELIRRLQKDKAAC